MLPPSTSSPSTSSLPPPHDSYNGLSLGQANEYLAVGAIFVIFLLFFIAFSCYRGRRRQSGVSDIEVGVRRNQAMSAQVQIPMELLKIEIEASIFTYGEAEKGDGSNCRYDEECVICLNEFEKGDTCQSFTKCNHTFHQNCIDGWLKVERHCPLCRNSVVIVIETIPSNSEAAEIS